MSSDWTPPPASPHIRETVREILTTERADLEKAEALVEVAWDLQKKPKDAQELADALYLYDRALELSNGQHLAWARAMAGRGAALRRMPSEGTETLEPARDALDAALTILREAGEPEEIAEIEMTLGLVIQSLAHASKAPLNDAVQAYQRALRTFRSESHPREFAILHNNLATAYLSMKLSPERDKLREALAVQSFREALTVVTLDGDPSEYAMLQNNLGNALQALRTSHVQENLRRAVEAYDEALKVRTPHDTPIEYANTIANKANALMNLLDDPEDPDAKNPINLRQAINLLRQAAKVFKQHGVNDRASIVITLAEDLDRELRGEAMA